MHLVCGKIEWRISDLLYADDVAFVAESGCELNEMVNKFNRVCIRRGLKINVDKSKDRKSTRLNSSHRSLSRMPSSA